jgi:hypothetical protein
MSPCCFRHRVCQGPAILSKGSKSTVRRGGQPVSPTGDQLDRQRDKSKASWSAEVGLVASSHAADSRRGQKSAHQLVCVFLIRWRQMRLSKRSVPAGHRSGSDGNGALSIARLSAAGSRREYWTASRSHLPESITPAAIRRFLSIAWTDAVADQRRESQSSRHQVVPVTTTLSAETREVTMLVSILCFFVIIQLLSSVPCADVEWRVLGLGSQYPPSSILSGCSFDLDGYMRSATGRQAGHGVSDVPWAKR